MSSAPTKPGQQRTTRLAPSPTGALHLGNARTFLITWALARAQGWKVLLRVEDLDTPRVKLAGGRVVQETIDTLAWLGMDWDEGPIVQSQDEAQHRQAMRTLVEQGLAFPSSLTRAQLLELSTQGTGEPGDAPSIHESPQSAPNEGSHEVRFPASLRPRDWFGRASWDFHDDQPAWRFATPPDRVVFEDAIAGPQSHMPSQSVGDFIIWTRREQHQAGQASYQLAVVVDDARQGVTEIVRGDDLLDSTARQLLLARALGLWANLPMFYHVPLVRGHDGRRLAKRHGDSRIDLYRGKGVPKERIIGLVAYWSGVQDRRVPMDAWAFRDRFSLDKLPRSSVIMTQEDHAWLLEG